MSNNLKNKIFYVVMVAAIFIVPVLLNDYLTSRHREKFYERTENRNRICRERAKEDSVDGRWCDEIQVAAEQAFSSADNASSINVSQPIFATLLFILAISAYHQKNKAQN